MEKWEKNSVYKVLLERKQKSNGPRMDQLILLPDNIPSCLPNATQLWTSTRFAIRKTHFVSLAESIKTVIVLLWWIHNIAEAKI